MLRLAVYILPEHIWKNIDEKAGQTRQERADRRLRPVHLRGPRRGQFIRFERQPELLGRPSRRSRSWSSASSRARTRWSQALKKGEIDFADSLDADVFDSLDAREGITRVPAEYSGFDELAFNTGAALTERHPDR